jgi:hypothetical protein
MRDNNKSYRKNSSAMPTEFLVHEVNIVECWNVAKKMKQKKEGVMVVTTFAFLTLPARKGFSEAAGYYTGCWQ